MHILSFFKKKKKKIKTFYILDFIILAIRLIFSKSCIQKLQKTGIYDSLKALFLD